MPVQKTRAQTRQQEEGEGARSARRRASVPAAAVKPRGGQHQVPHPPQGFPHRQEGVEEGGRPTR